VVPEPLQLTRRGSSFPDRAGTRANPPLGAGDATHRSRRRAALPALREGSPRQQRRGSALRSCWPSPPLYYPSAWGGDAARSSQTNAAGADRGTAGRQVVSLHRHPSPALISINAKLQSWEQTHILYCFSPRWTDSHSHCVCGVSRDQDFMILNQ